MADKSFGVKQLNLIGIGTPTIESPSNINLDAVNVAISTDATVGRNLNVTGIVTASEARLGSPAPASSLAIINGSGVNITGVVTATSFIKYNGTSSQFLKADGSVDSSTYLTSYVESQTLNDVLGLGNTSTTGLSVGVATATSFVKSGGTSSQFLKADGSVDSSTYISSIGISSAGNSIGNATTLNFIGTGNTFAVNGNTIDISIAGGGGGGSGFGTYFSEQQSTSSPNNVDYVSSFTGIGATTDIDVALVPKGTGAILGNIPDGTTTGGNKRGAYAVDLQLSRNTASDVASGQYSAIIGGNDNSATGQQSAVVGGNNNVASGQYSAVVGGTSNAANAQKSAIVGGNSNGTTAWQSFIGGGDDNVIRSGADASAIVGGYSNVIDYAYVGSAIVGGTNNEVDNYYSSVFGGWYNKANGYNSVVIGGVSGTAKGIDGIFVVPANNNTSFASLGTGEVQATILNVHKQTTNATPIALASDSNSAGSTNQLVLLNNSAVAFKGTCIAGVTGAGNTKAWEFRGAIKRGANASSTAIVGSVIKDVLAYDSGAAAWDVDFTADTTNGALKVTVTGQASTTIRWVCKIETTEMAF